MAGEEFIIKSDNCEILPKSGDSCKPGTTAHNLPEKLGLDSYKVCLQNGGLGNFKSNVETTR